jgi:non-ribosomal peptide synthetase component F
MYVRFTNQAPGQRVVGVRTGARKILGSTRPDLRTSGLAEAERALLAACSDPEGEIPSEASIPQLIAEQVCIRPMAVAAVADGEELSYAQLWARSGALAARLRVAGARRGQLVGLCCERSLDLLTGMLGILRSGAAYVPLDSSLPVEQLTFMRGDAGLQIIVAQPGVTQPDGPYRTILVDPAPVQLGELECAALLEDDSGAAGPDDPACLSFAAAPHGPARTVLSSHRKVLRLLAEKPPIDREPAV